MHPFIWPASTQDGKKFSVRLGRLSHWTCLIAAILILCVGFFDFSHQLERNNSSELGNKAWVDEHAEPTNAATGDHAYRVTVNSGDTILVIGPHGMDPETLLRRAHEQHPGRHYAMPDVYEMEYDSLWIGLLGMVGLAALGRGLRYLIAAE